MFTLRQQQLQRIGRNERGGDHEKDQQQENNVRHAGHAELNTYLISRFEGHTILMMVRSGDQGTL